MGKSGHRKHGEGSIYKRADGRYSGFITLENRKRKYFYGKTEKEVLKKIRQAIYERDQGMLATGPQLQKLAMQHVQSLCVQKLEEGLSVGRVQAIHMVLHGALRYAVRTNLVVRNVSDGVDLPALKKREVKPLEPKQAQVLLQKVGEHRLGSLLTLAVATGMREGELLALRWQDVDLNARELQVRRNVRYLGKRGFYEGEPKTESGVRRIILPDFLIGVLKQHRVLQLEERLQAGALWIDRDLVFCRSNGDFIIAHTLRKQFRRILKEIGFSPIRFHDLRHTAATLLLSMGVPMKVVQDILGHSNMATTANIYSHVLPSIQQEAMEKMDGLLGQRDRVTE